MQDRARLHWPAASPTLAIALGDGQPVLVAACLLIASLCKLPPKVSFMPILEKPPV